MKTRSGLCAVAVALVFTPWLCRKLLGTHQAANEEATGDKGLLTRKEAMAILRLGPAHFSKVTNAKVQGLPRLACVRIGRRQLFRKVTVERWIIEVEAQSCNGAR